MPWRNVGRVQGDFLDGCVKGLLSAYAGVATTDPRFVAKVWPASAAATKIAAVM